MSGLVGQRHGMLTISMLDSVDLEISFNSAFNMSASSILKAGYSSSRFALDQPYTYETIDQNYRECYLSLRDFATLTNILGRYRYFLYRVCAGAQLSDKKPGHMPKEALGMSIRCAFTLKQLVTLRGVLPRARDMLERWNVL